MEYPIELGVLADATGNISQEGKALIFDIPQIAKDVGLELDLNESRVECHNGRRRGGRRFVRYVAVAPAGADVEVWKAKAPQFEARIRRRMSGRKPHKR